MNDTLLTIIAVLLLVLIAVFAYNMIQENRYRAKIRDQFGHADRDALLGSKTQSVRDGQNLSHDKLKTSKPKKMPKPKVAKTPTPKPVVIEPVAAAAEPLFTPPPVRDVPAPKLIKATSPSATVDDNKISTSADGKLNWTAPISSPYIDEPNESIEDSIAVSLPENPMPDVATVSNREITSPAHRTPAETVATPVAPPAPVKDLLVDLHDLSSSQLSWFDPRADYMAYVSLREPQELYAVPRLSNRYRFQIIGCTMDGLFQVAEPIPGVMYQAFVIGLQAISRNGLANERELELFGHQVKSFTDKMNGEMLLTDIPAFLEVARPLDQICERVDQTIAIHLVSRISILGIELRSTLEDLGFQLMQDGTFGFCEVGGEVKYNAVTLDGSQFTSSLLASQPYKGFSMLFDITRVPHGESNFDEFMNLAVRLSSKLNLELVDDQIKELSTEWLKDVRSYVLDRQSEMLKVGIEPGGVLAQRLFS